jgi:hypothetical protein
MRTFILSLAALLTIHVLPTGVAVAEARSYTAAERQVIRSMPITSRPNRPGHFYGNTVRRLNSFGR